jgi:[ribulose-bisphosphate carboxylase]/[fructose-bisphosphate aldolase]-lysine N-methyltransferase
MALPLIKFPPRLLSPPTSISSQFRKNPTRAVLQSKESATSLPSLSSLSNFSNWLISKGAVAPSVKPGPVPQGLGLIAQKDISKNEMVLEVPKKLWIDADTVATSEIGRVCSGLRPWICIGLFLLRERALGDASPWKPYLDVLPSSTDSTIFW